jgi:hypothetical protein
VIAHPDDRHPYDRVVTALRQRGGSVRPRSLISVRAACPAHSDVKPSLVVTKRHDRVLLKCFAGCRVSEVVMALGLRMADLFIGSTRATCQKREVACYDYTDRNGVLMAQKLRLHPKSFRWRVPTDAPGGGYRWNLHGAQPGLYRLVDICDARRVLLVEGEKAVERLWQLGFIATCPPAGASTWRPEWAVDLWHAGCHDVIILADSDRAGREHALRVAASCYAVTSIAQEPAGAPEAPWTAPANVLDTQMAGLKVKVIELDTFPGGDVCDWLEAGHGAADLTAEVDAAPYWTPDGAQQARKERKRAQGRERVRRHRERQRADHLRCGGVTHRTNRSTVWRVTRNAVTHPERTSSGLY